MVNSGRQKLIVNEFCSMYIYVFSNSPITRSEGITSIADIHLSLISYHYLLELKQILDSLGYLLGYISIRIPREYSDTDFLH